MQGEPGIICQSCEHPNGPGSKFCNECGNRIDGACASCGHENAVGAKFCNGCGYRLTGGEEEPDRPDSEPDSRESSSILCPRCLRLNEPESQFCYSCGIPLTGEIARAARPASRAFEHGAPGGFWIRGAALVIDIVVVMAAVVSIFLIFGAHTEEFDEDTSGALSAGLISLAFLLLYSPALIGLWGTTLGKRAFSLYVLGNDGTRCGFWQALGRQFALIPSLALVGIGYFMIAFRADKRGIHDFIANTAVVRR